MPLPDVNRLFAAPWPELQAQFVRDLRAAVTGRRLDADNRHTGAAVQYQLRLALDAPELTAHIAAPPGFEELSRTSVRLAVPLDPGGWSLDLTARLNGFLDVWGLGARFLDYQIHDQPQIVRVRTFRLVADVASDDFTAERPDLTEVQLAPTLHLELSGFLEAQLALESLDTQVGPDGGFVFTAEISGVKIRAVDNAELGGTLTLTLGDAVRLDFDGRLKVPLGTVPLRLSNTFPLPQPVGEALRLIGAQQDWGRGHPQPPTPIPAGTDLGLIAREVEAASRAHTPHGASFDLVLKDGFTPCAPTPGAPHAYYGEDDSAIWTGHLLAAQAFRYAAARRRADLPEQQAALRRAGEALAGLETLFHIPTAATEAAAGQGGRLTGLLCRAALPDDSPIQTEVPLRDPKPADRHNYYVGVNLNGARWSALGRDSDPPSRDSHTGVALGLACALHLIDEPSLRARVVALTTDLLHYLLGHGWNVPTPAGDALTVGPDGRVVTTIKTSFLFEFHQQLALLRLGKSAAPALFGPAYDAASGAADFCWLPVWGDCLEPVGKYYKFNLDHATLGVLLLLEEDAGLRAHYRRALTMLRRTVGHHRNAFFNLWWVLADPAAAGAPAEGTEGVNVAEETRGLLYEWYLRTVRVPGERCALPRKETPSVVYLTNLGAEKVRPYRQFGAPDPIALSTFPLSPRYRPGKDLDFCWQRPPFLTGLDIDKDGAVDFGHVDLGQPTQEAPGLDYLLPYYMGAYLGVIGH